MTNQFESSNKIAEISFRKADEGCLYWQISYRSLYDCQSPRFSLIDSNSNNFCFTNGRPKLTSRNIPNTDIYIAMWEGLLSDFEIFKLRSLLDSDFLLFIIDLKNRMPFSIDINDFRDASRLKNYGDIIRFISKEEKLNISDLLIMK